MKQAKVFIVGAGPGDPGLVTVKGQSAIKCADVILYDELVSESLLKNAKEGAELKYVGKKAGCHTLPQDEICSLIATYANKGKTVCRLKGGDPFVFGRGGEEAETLAREGIEYEVVPGVTSAVAAPAYAGIPVTMRNYTSGVAVFTGHEDPTKEASDLNWKAIATLDSTLVFLMGMNNLELIVRKLFENGMDETMPVAVIHRGTTALQRTLTGTLKDIVGIVDREGISAPSVIVVGKVVGLRRGVSWFEKRPLMGRQILVTRTRKQAGRLSDRLGALGAMVYEFPTIEIVPNEASFPKLDSCIKSISKFDWIIFTSANAVEIFIQRMTALNLDVRALGGTKICAIGPATGDKLKEYFVTPDLIPQEYVSESILEAMKDEVRGKSILLPRAGGARDVLPQGLEKEGALVEVVDVYSTRAPTSSRGELLKLLEKTDLVTFTSSSTVDNFVSILGDEIAKWKERINAASIGPITSRTLAKHGIKPICEAKRHDIEGLVEAIEKTGVRCQHTTSFSFPQ